ncbi:MAG TPA: Coenzyme F420 hydrogenase/dehydrogenase, beta subunit C-terminal domain [Deltaproteobacteria bacterium]|nr:Coenzyme F420 hydrogenase/dehydrogenase, beta subunit C-terminal domain [Deltaproteobacteria bacterium]HPR55639.1 Coenzyme F420 hydrogenase/dehydrogenase, beta subunit C-terminal domain [Deltaproteobacteria bacterium]HXK47412.1 Coenzyme F420 hydrogenase/dehydrogenase, beta subunit C-terminal domain [Deltaproteobacteria bacterium]
MDEKKDKGQSHLNEKVRNAKLCTGCGACVNLCPYQRSHEDKVIAIFPCDIDEGRCYAFCPRTPVDLEALRARLFDPADLTPEIGAMKGYYLARASSSRVRDKSQHGGTVSTLMALAMKEGIIDAAVMAKRDSSGLTSGVSESDPKRLTKLGKSSFVVSPGVAEFHRIAKEDFNKIGVVATPCQSLAYVKMRMKPVPDKPSNIDKLSLVVGLFCSWALAWEPLMDLIGRKTDPSTVTGMDVPPVEYKSMQVFTTDGVVDLPIDDVKRCVRGACNYCFDLTSEFSDVSVGSAILNEPWESARQWNQVIARTALGLELIELAGKKRLLEFREVPDGNLEALKIASMHKKRTALKNLRLKTHSADDLVYLDKDDPVFREILKGG